MTAEAATRCHLWISGDVQGVGFRFFAEDEAARLGLAGFVRNLPDGRVEAVAEGGHQDLLTFAERLRRGPAGARVRDVETVWEAPAGISGFRIVP